MSLLFLSLLSWALPTQASAGLKPDNVHVADAKKTLQYLTDGMVVGGDRAIDDVVIRDIRRAPNSGFERIVIDLEGTRSGERAAIPRPPYYQVSVSSDEQRLVFTVWGHPKLGFEAPKVHAAFKKSQMVSGLELFPRLNEDSWTFAMGLKPGKSVEVFELSSPVRIIVDIRNDPKKAN